MGFWPEKKLVGQKSLFFYKQCFRRSSGFIPLELTQFLRVGRTRSSGPSVKHLLERVHLRWSAHDHCLFWQFKIFIMKNGTFLALVPIVYMILTLQVFVLSMWPHKLLFLLLLLVGQLVKGIMVSLVFPRKGET